MCTHTLNDVLKTHHLCIYFYFFLLFKLILSSFTRSLIIHVSTAGKFLQFTSWDEKYIYCFIYLFIYILTLCGVLFWTKKLLGEILYVAVSRLWFIFHTFLIKPVFWKICYFPWSPIIMLWHSSTCELASGYKVPSRLFVASRFSCLSGPIVTDIMPAH